MSSRKGNIGSKPQLKARTRRAFLKNTALLAAAPLVAPLAQALANGGPGVAPAAASAMTSEVSAGVAAVPLPAAAAGQKLVGIQIGPESFVDEGIEPLLDWLGEKAGVNAIFLTTFTYGQGFAGRLTPGRLFPDHGHPASSGAPFHGGNFATPHEKYYAGTILKDTRAPDHGGRDILAEVIPAARHRGMKVFCGLEDRWDKAFDVPGLAACAEVDLRGRSAFDRKRSITTCVFNPHIRAFWPALATDLNASYDIDGCLFLNERSGPLMNVLGITPFRKGVGDTSHVACFCEHHRQAAIEQHIDFDRAKQGYEKLYAFVQAALKDQRPSDGYYVTFQQLLRDYPEIEAYDRLCDVGKLGIVDEVRTAIKSVHPDRQLVFHVEQTISTNPWTRASLSYQQLCGKADFLKPATYNNCAGERYANFVGNIGATIFRDLPPEEVYSLLNHWLNYEGLAPLKELPMAGLPPDYVYRETQRAVAGVKGQCGILSGIDVSVPVEPGSRKASPEDTYAATMAALKAGAQGVMLSRKYSEMWRGNLEGAGRAIRAFADL
jgi:hypothetical protein